MKERPPVSAASFHRLTPASASEERGPVAEEVPVAIVYRTRPHAVVMATPADLEDLAVGFTLSEQIVSGLESIADIRVQHHARGIDVAVDIPADVVAKLADRARSLAVRTGCGLCGVEAIEDAVRAPVRVTSSLTFEHAALWRAAEELGRKQVLNEGTHAIHAAAWATADGAVQFVREDVGRHNALDKVLGALVRAGRNPAEGFLVVTSRASFELVQKAAVFGVPLLGAVSRPTGLAISISEQAGICLVGLLRGESANVYTHPDRIKGLK